MEDKVRGLAKSGPALALFLKEKDEKEHASVLEAMEPRYLMDVFSINMPHLFDCMLTSSDKELLLERFLRLFQIPKLAHYIGNVLLHFLVTTKLDTLRKLGTPTTNLVLYLFKCLFADKSTLFELESHISTIMGVCMENCCRIDKPHAYIQLLRIMISSGRFNFIPYIQPCFNMLMDMIEAPVAVETTHLILELCLSIPHSFLGYYLPMLMKPLMKVLALALKGSNADLLGLAFPMLEILVDKTSTKVLHESVILSLYSHLRPKPYPWGPKALQILGRLGGGNRKFLKAQLEVEEAENGLSLLLSFEPATSFVLSLDRSIHLSRAIALSSIPARKHALKFLQACLSALLNLKVGSIGNKYLTITAAQLRSLLLITASPTSMIEVGGIGNGGLNTTAAQLSSLLITPISPSSPTPAMEGVQKTRSQFIAECRVLKMLLMTVIAASDEDPKDEFVWNVCRHFAMIFHIRSIHAAAQTAKDKSQSNLKELDPLIFLDALVAVLADENRQHAKAALNALNVFSGTLRILLALNPTPSSHSPPVFGELLQRILHCCYGSNWKSQMAGVMGVGSLLGEVPMELHARASHALIYVLKQLPPQYANKEQEEAGEVLRQLVLITVVNEEAHSQRFQGVLDVLAAELFNPNSVPIVRRNVESCVALLASRTGITVTQLLQPVYQPLLQPLITRALCSIPHYEQQVGTVMALNYCMSLQPPLLIMTPVLRNILQEALKIAKSDENLELGKNVSPKSTVAFRNLRTVCIELVCSCTSTAWVDFRNATHEDLQSQIIAMLFESLICPTPEIVAVAKDGLQKVLQQHTVPKVLLQKSLRSILAKFSRTESLSMPLLHGISHLVEFLSEHSCLCLRASLMRHLRKMLKPENLAETRISWKSGDETKIAAGDLLPEKTHILVVTEMIELCHLLPDTTIFLLDELVTMTLQLELALPKGGVYSELNSPYHLPLTKFLNRHATEAVDYFLGRLTQPIYFRKFLDIIQSESGQILRDELARSPKKVISSSFLKTDIVEGTTSDILNPTTSNPVISPVAEGLSCSGIQSAEVQSHGIALVYTLVKLKPDWIYNNRSVFDALMVIWKSPAGKACLRNEQNLTLSQVKEIKGLLKCFLSYLRYDKNEFYLLFDLISIFLGTTSINDIFLKKFYMVEVSEGYSPPQKKLVLLHFLHLFHNKDMPQDQVVVTMQILIIPMLDHSFQNNQNWEVVDDTILNTIVKKLLYPPKKVYKDYGEPLRIQLLQLATLLLKYFRSNLQKHRQNLSKFGWDNLRRKGSPSRKWAFVFVCLCVEAFQETENKKNQVFLALLQPSQPKNRMLVKEALDILMPALSRLVPLQDYSSPPFWILHTSKLLNMENQSLERLIHALQLIVWHSDLFYSWHALFVPQMVKSLIRLPKFLYTSQENRWLSIDVAGIVVAWERKGLAQPKSARTLNQIENHISFKNDSMDGLDRASKVAGITTASNEICMQTRTNSRIHIQSTFRPTLNLSSCSAVEFKPSAATEEAVINFLVQEALSADEKMAAMYNRALDVLTQAVEVWPAANIKFNYMDKLFPSQVHPSGQTQYPSIVLAHGLEVMNKFLEKQPYLFIRNNVHQIIQLLEPCFNSNSPDVQKSFCNLLQMAFNDFPLDATSTTNAVNMLHEKVEQLIQKNLASITIGQPAVETSVLNAAIGFQCSILETLNDKYNSYIDHFMPQLVRVFQPVTCEMDGSLGEGFAENAVLLMTDLVKVPNLKPFLRLINGRVLLEPEFKPLFGQALQSILGEKGTDASVLLTVIDIIKDWIDNDFQDFQSSSSTASLKWVEGVVSFLLTLSKVDRQNMIANVREEWDEKYLNMIYCLCWDESKYPLAIRQEIFDRVERPFMLGIRACDPKMRKKFIDIYHKSIGRTFFNRLQYIFVDQDWEALSDDFWLKQALDLLLAMLLEHEPITLAPNSAQLPLLISSSRIRMKIPSEAPKGDDGSPCTFLVNEHAKFLNDMSKLQVADLVIPLRELAHADSNIAYSLWVLVFPLVWTTLQKEEQLALVDSMKILLSKNYHIKQRDERPNVVQALLEGLSLCQPQPKIPIELIKFLGKTYNAWHIVLSLLESHVIQYPQQNRCFDALSELYNRLNEEDIQFGLWKWRTNISPETRAGLSLIQHGFWNQAQDVFYQAINKSTEGKFNNELSSQSELCLLEEQWLACAKQLNQWEVIACFAEQIDNYDILLESLWRISNWGLLKERIIPNAEVEESSKLKMIHAYVALHEGRNSSVSEAETRIGEGVELALYKWWGLPEIVGQSHLPLLQQFQKLVELHESSILVLNLPNTNNHYFQLNQNQGDFVNIMNAWRLRTPNEWDHISVWYDIFQWRHHMYNTVMNALQDISVSNPNINSLVYSNKAWGVNQLAHVARKHDLHYVCLSILNNMYQHPTITKEEGFVKMREHAKACIETKGELINGLNLINGTNLSYFHVDQRAEIIRLKGVLLQKMNDSAAACDAFSTTVTHSTDPAKGWLSWGIFSDQMFKETNEEIWLRSCAICLMKSIKYGISNVHSHIARVLYLLSFENENGTVGKDFDMFGDDIPLWVWIQWIPQLLLSLKRPEAPHCKYILLKLSDVYPQELYYWLRTYIIKSHQTAIEAEHARSKVGVFETAMEILGVLKNKHCNMVCELEAMIIELSARFVPLPEERNLEDVHYLLDLCYKNSSFEFPQGLKGVLQDVSRVLSEEASYNFPETIAELIKLLRHRKAELQSHVEDCLPAVLNLEDQSQRLHEFHGQDIQIPGQHFNDQEMAPDRSVKLDRIGSDVVIVRRHGISNRQITMVGSDGSQHHFLVQNLLHPRNALSDERMVQLFRIFNHYFHKHKESRKRHLAFHTPLIIPICQEVWLIEDDPLYSTFGEVYERYCALRGQEADSPIINFKEHLNQAISGNLSNEDIINMRHRIYREITSNLVTEHIFSQYMCKILPSFDHLWIFKKQFAAQLALSGFISHILHIGGHSPNNILFGKNTGKVFQKEFYPEFDGNGLVKFSEPVPFRMTPNLQKFFTPFMVEGIFVSSVCAAAQSAVSSKNQHLQFELSMYFRDELLSWYSRITPGIAIAPDSGFLTNADLKDKVSSNVEEVLNRLKNIAPQTYLEEDENASKSVQRVARELVEAAMQPKNLCMMDPTWHPWF